MMPDLGKYADAVLWSYASGLAVLAVLVIATLRASAKSRKELKDVEDRING